VTEARPRYRWVVLFAGFVANGAFSGAMWGLPSLGPALREHHHLDLAQAGLVVSAMIIGVIPVMLLWGMLADRVGERLVLTVCLVGAGMGMVMAAFASSVTTLVAGLLLVGLLGGGNSGAGGRSMMGWFAANERGFALTVRIVAAPVGGVLLSLTLPAIADGWGLRYCFLALAGVMLGAAVCCLVLMRDPPSRLHHEPATAMTGSPITDRRLWRLSAGGALFMATQGALSALLVIFLHDVRGFSPGGAAAAWALVQAATIPARLLISLLSDRIGLRLRPMRAMAISSAALTGVVALLAHGPGELLYPILLVGATMAMSWNGLGVTAAAEFGGYRRAGTAMALFVTIISIVMTVAAISFGALVQTTSWSAGFAVLAALAFAGGVLMTPLVKEERRQRAVVERAPVVPPAPVAVP